MDPAELFTCVLPVLPYSAQESPFILVGKGLRPVGVWVMVVVVKWDHRGGVMKPPGRCGWKSESPRL